MPGLEQGRVFSGREALAFKLIDEIGGEPEAVKYLEEPQRPQGPQGRRLEAQAGRLLAFSAGLAGSRVAFGVSWLGQVLSRDPNLSTLAP